MKKDKLWGKDNYVALVVCVLVSCLKLLLIPSYRSTDFEVHRNWLAITSSVPLKEWYYENTSEWTLDYPPIFAYFEWFLALFANLFDPDMLLIENLNYNSHNTVIFLRLSVVVTDFVLYLASWKILLRMKFCSSLHRLATFGLVLFNSSLILVDHVHFQYNGILLGILFLAIYFADKNPFLVTFFFGTLLLMKHLFVYLLPIFACVVLRQAFYAHNKLIPQMWTLITVLGVTVSLLLFAFAPFLIFGGKDQLHQMFTRLFPFGRGLIHAYWAPNFWAFYVFSDKLLGIVLPRIFVSIQIVSDGLNSSSGKVGNYTLAFLPQISAFHCLVIVMTIITLCSVLTVFKSGKQTVLLRSVVFTSLTSFMLGYHVHEKAIVIPLIVQTFLLDQSDQDRALYLFLALSATTSIFPLISGYLEWMLKCKFTTKILFS
eukprot:gene7560-8162_t